MTTQPIASLPLPALAEQLASRAKPASGPSQDASAERVAGIDSQVETLKEFEAVFVSMLIKELRKSAEGLFPGDTTDSLGVLFDTHIGRQIADGGGLGLSTQLARYLEAQRT